MTPESQGRNGVPWRSSTLLPRTVTPRTPEYLFRESRKAAFAGTFSGSSGRSKASVTTFPFATAGSAAASAGFPDGVAVPSLVRDDRVKPSASFPAVSLSGLPVGLA